MTTVCRDCESSTEIGSVLMNKGRLSKVLKSLEMEIDAAKI